MLSDGTIAGGMIANTKYRICHDGAACRNLRNADYLDETDEIATVTL